MDQLCAQMMLMMLLGVTSKEASVASDPLCTPSGDYEVTP